MPPPGHNPPKTPAKSVKEFVTGEKVEVRRALDVDTGEPLPPVEEGFFAGMVREAVIKTIKHWGYRQILKLLASLSAAMGTKFAADGEGNAAVASWAVGILCWLAEMAASWLSKKRWQNKYLKGKTVKTSIPLLLLCLLLPACAQRPRIDPALFATPAEAAEYERGFRDGMAHGIQTSLNP